MSLCSKVKYGVNLLTAHDVVQEVRRADVSLDVTISK